MVSEMNNIIEIKIPAKTVGYLLEKSQEKMETSIPIPDPSSPKFLRDVRMLCALQNINMKWAGHNLIGRANDIFIAFCKMVVAQIQPANECLFRCPTNRSVRGSFMGLIGQLGSILTNHNHCSGEIFERGISLLRLANEVAGSNVFYV